VLLMRAGDDPELWIASVLLASMLLVIVGLAVTFAIGFHR
jgi:hypothetical protein